MMCDADPWSVPFNRPYMTGKELSYIAQAHADGALAGDGPFTKRCHALLELQTGCAKALLTHSCTAALEIAAMLLDCAPGDEVIMPSYTFVSTANAFALRGATPVFVDVREDTLNLDERLVEAAITPRTKANVAVHYAGVACEMDALLDIVTRHGVRLIEDAAQGVMSTYKGRPLGSIGNLGTYSFHETKNITSGEGGALLVNEPELVVRAEIIREKGTDRSRFFRGEVDKYTWQEVGSSYLAGELAAAFLWAQLEAGGLPPQRAHVLCAARREHRPRARARRSQSVGSRCDFPLCPAALLTRGAAVRPRARGTQNDELPGGASDPPAPVDRAQRNGSGADRREPQRRDRRELTGFTRGRPDHRRRCRALSWP